MGEYLNPGNALFYRSLNSEIYVDKSMLIEQTNRRLYTEDRYLCVSRPRRFGKSMTLNMLAAYYSRGCNSREMFSRLKIASSLDFEKHLNQYNVICINVVHEIGQKSVAQLIDRISSRLLFECKRAYPDISHYDSESFFHTLHSFISAVFLQQIINVIPIHVQIMAKKR